MLFHSRTAAGRQLAGELTAYAKQAPVVLALPRGGVPVGYEIAHRLNAPLDTIVARKLGAPENPEYGFGAIAPGDVRIVDQAAVRALGLSKAEVESVIVQERQELERRIALYQSGRYSGSHRFRAVILVDDGLATGVTALAAIASIRHLYPNTPVVFAAPVCASDSAERVAARADQFVCLARPANFMAVGQWYEHFDQVSDEEVIRLLERAKLEGKGASRSPAVHRRSRRR